MERSPPHHHFYDAMPGDYEPTMMLSPKHENAPIQSPDKTRVRQQSPNLVNHTICDSPGPLPLNKQPQHPEHQNLDTREYFEMRNVELKQSHFPQELSDRIFRPERSMMLSPKHQSVSVLSPEKLGVQPMPMMFKQQQETPHEVLLNHPLSSDSPLPLNKNQGHRVIECT